MSEKKPKWIDETVNHVLEMVNDIDSYGLDDIREYVRAKLIESFKNGKETEQNRKQGKQPSGQRRQRPTDSRHMSATMGNNARIGADEMEGGY